MTAPLYVRRRSDYNKTLDDIPTPPWVTRAFIEKVLIPAHGPANDTTTAHEPAAGRGHMLKTMAEYFGRRNVSGADIKDYKDKVYPRIQVRDFREGKPKSASYYLTNPPFKLMNEFWPLMMQGATWGVGIYCKTLFAEGGTRYNEIFGPCRPTKIIILSARMPGAKRKIVRKAPAYLSHSWFWWDMLDRDLGQRDTVFDWFPPDTQQRFERDEDYK